MSKKAKINGILQDVERQAEAAKVTHRRKLWFKLGILALHVVAFYAQSLFCLDYMVRTRGQLIDVQRRLDYYESVSPIMSFSVARG